MLVLLARDADCWAEYAGPVVELLVLDSRAAGVGVAGHFVGGEWDRRTLGTAPVVAVTEGVDYAPASRVQRLLAVATRASDEMSQRYREKVSVTTELQRVSVTMMVWEDM